jgi:hypothetical protein
MRRESAGTRSLIIASTLRGLAIEPGQQSRSPVSANKRAAENDYPGVVLDADERVESGASQHHGRRICCGRDPLKTGGF